MIKEGGMDRRLFLSLQEKNTDDWPTLKGKKTHEKASRCRERLGRLMHGLWRFAADCHQAVEDTRSMFSESYE